MNSPRVTGSRQAQRLLCICCVLTGFPLTGIADDESSGLFQWTGLNSPREIVGTDEFRLATVDHVLLAFPIGTDQRSIAVLADPTASWRKANLSSSNLWRSVWRMFDAGATLTAHDDRLICLGGGTSDVLTIRAVDETLTVSRWPALPESISHASAAVLDGVLYVAGRIVSDDVTGKHAVWALSLTDPIEQASWSSVRSLQYAPTAVVSQDGSLLLFGDAPTGLRFSPKTGWQPMAGPPEPLNRPVAFPVGPTHVLVSDIGQAGSAFFYHTITDTWRHIDAGAPLQLDANGLEGLSAVSVVSWKNGVVVARGGNIQFGQPQRSTAGLRTVDVMVLCGYLLLLIAMGCYFARRRQDSNDYFLAGQRIPWWAAGLSLLGTSISAITFMAFPAMSFRTDWVYWLGNLMIVAVAPPVIWYYLPFYRRLRVTSAYEYLEHRFGLTTRLLGSATFLLFQLGRMGVVVYLPALALSAVSGWNIYVCIAAIGILATIYTTLGGIEAVIWTDVLQVFVLLGGALASFAVILTSVPGGPAEIVSASLSAGKLHAVNVTWSMATTGLWVVMLGNFFKFLIPYSSDQSVIQRYLTTSDEKQAARGIWLNAVLSVPVWTIFFALGTMLWAFYSAFPDKLDPVGGTDEIFAWFIVHELPAGVTGLVVAGLFAASMSTLDSSMNSMATVLTTDFFRRLRNRDNGDESHDLEENQRDLAVARVATLLFGLFGTLTAAWLAWVGTQSIWDQFLKLIGLFGSGLAGMFMAGIFTRRTHQTGILIGFVTSTVALIVARASGNVHFFLYGAIGILTCSIVGWLVSLVLPGPQKNIDGLTVHSLRQS